MKSKKMVKLSEIIEKVTRLAKNMDNSEDSFSQLEKQLMLNYIKEMHEHVASLKVVENEFQHDQTKKVHETEIKILTSAMQINAKQEADVDVATECEEQIDSESIDEPLGSGDKIVLDLNKKMGFINVLFSGNLSAFENALSLVQNCQSPDDAQNIIEQKMGPKWNDEEEMAVEFIDYIRQNAASNKMRVAQ